jgi:hypothetical protein
VRELEQRDLLENTILVVTSDHGEEFEDHGRMSHGLSLYEEVVRVPLVFHAPHRIPPGRHGPASLLDVVPTLEGLLELEPAESRPSLDGISQAAILRGEEVPAGMRPFLYHLDHVDGTALALARGRNKLVLERSPHIRELLDLIADPHESRNLLLQGEEREFAQIAADLAATYNSYSRQAAPRRPASLHEELRGKLAALGYAAPERTENPRKIPRRIAPADITPGGLLGWEGEAALPSCFDLAGPDVERLLFGGWNGPEPKGRWSKQTGVIVLGTPPGESRATLVLNGVSYRPDTPRVTVSVEHHRLLEAPIPPGAFRLTAPVDRLPNSGSLVIEIATDPVFLPAKHGLMDDRSLGVFLFSACLQPVDPPAAELPDRLGRMRQPGDRSKDG